MSRLELEPTAYRYPEDWPAIAAEVRGRAGGRCECLGECRNPFCPGAQDPDGRCTMQEQRHFPPLWVVALDRNPSNAGQIDDRPNLRAFCASCADAYLYDLKERPRGKDPVPKGASRPAVQVTLDL